MRRIIRQDQQQSLGSFWLKGKKIKLLKIDYENGMSKRELKKKYNMGGGTIVKILGYDKK